MAGMFPEFGTNAANTDNAELNVETTVGCPPLFFRNNCFPKFDPASANAVISEILNAINLVQPYDCSRLDNLATAIGQLVNLCGLPQEMTPELTDSLAGCFEGENGRITLSQLREALGTCGLPVATNPDTNDTFAMCVDGENVQVPVSSISGILAPAVPAWLSVGTLVLGRRVDSNGDFSIMTAPNSFTAVPMPALNAHALQIQQGPNVTFGTWRAQGCDLGHDTPGDSTVCLWLRIA